MHCSCFNWRPNRDNAIQKRHQTAGEPSFRCNIAFSRISQTAALFMASRAFPERVNAEPRESEICVPQWFRFRPCQFQLRHGCQINVPVGRDRNPVRMKTAARSASSGLANSHCQLSCRKIVKLADGGIRIYAFKLFGQLTQALHGGGTLRRRHPEDFTRSPVKTAYGLFLMRTSSEQLP